MWHLWTGLPRFFDIHSMWLYMWLPRFVDIHRMWLYMWLYMCVYKFPCFKYRIYTVRTCVRLVLKKSKRAWYVWYRVWSWPSSCARVYIRTLVCVCVRAHVHVCLYIYTFESGAGSRQLALLSNHRHGRLTIWMSLHILINDSRSVLFYGWAHSPQVPYWRAPNALVYKKKHSSPLREERMEGLP